MGVISRLHSAFPPLCPLCSAHRLSTPPQLSAQEQKDIVNAFNDPAAAQASGIRLAGQKFFTLQANERSIYGKKAVRPPLCLTHTIARSDYALRAARRTAVCS